MAAEERRLTLRLTSSAPAPLLQKGGAKWACGQRAAKGSRRCRKGAEGVEGAKDTPPRTPPQPGIRLLSADSAAPTPATVAIPALPPRQAQGKRYSAGQISLRSGTALHAGPATTPSLPHIAGGSARGLIRTIVIRLGGENLARKTGSLGTRRGKIGQH